MNKITDAELRVMAEKKIYIGLFETIDRRFKLQGKMIDVNFIFTILAVCIALISLSLQIK